MDSEQLQRQLTILEAENSALRTQVNQRQSIEATLTTILNGTAAVTGDAFFQALVQSLAEVLAAKYIMLGELTGKEQDHIRTLAYWKIDGPAPNFEYELRGSPCATVIDNTLQYYPQNTWQLFPDDKPLVEKRIECYLGVPLFRSTGETLGILVVMDDKLSETVANFVPLISTFAARAAAELERKQNEESLRESEQRYRLLVEQSNDAIFLIRNSRFLLVNKRFYDLFEVTPDIIFAPDFNILTLIDASSAADITFRLQKSYQTTMLPERFEVIAQTINGRSLPIEVSISFVEFKEGAAIQGILRDLTRQKQIEAQQREQRELAEALHEIGMTFSASLEIDVILDLLLEQVERVIPYDSANVILIDGAQTRLVRARGYEKFGIDIDLATQPTVNLTETPLFRAMIDSGKPLLIPDITLDERWLHPEPAPHIRSWASAPILVEGKVVAFLSVNKAEANFYTTAHGSRLAAFAAQASLAWQNAHLLTAVSQRAQAFKATRDILRTLNAALDVQEAFPVIARHLEDLLGCQRITIAQLDSAQEWISFYGLHNGRLISDPTFRLHISETNAAANIKGGRPHIVPDITTELDQKAARALYAENIRAYVSLPLNDSQTIFGAFTAGWENAADFHEDQLPILQQIVDAIALGMERSRLFKTSQRRSQELNLLYQVMSAAASGHSKEEILETSCVEIAHFLQISHITLSLLNTNLPGGKPLPVVTTIGAQFIAPGELNLRGQQLSFQADSFLLGQLAQLTAPVSIESVAEFPLSPRMRRLADLYNLVSALIIPIMLRGSIIGIIGIGHREKRSFTEAEIQLLQTVADELGRVLEIAGLYEQLRDHAAELEVRVSERTWELADANERLTELDRMKSRFVSDVSHELRTPVTNLKLYLDLLERRGAEQLDHYLPILQKQADRLGQLIQDILDLSRLNLGHAELKFAPLDLNEVVMEVVIAHEPRIESAGLALAYQPEPDLPPVWGERNQLAQVVTNLLSNAIIYSTVGSIELKTAVSPTPAMVILEVSDTGIGIPAEDLPHLFDRFYRGQKARQSNIPGTGLGLAIAHEIISIHNGRLELESVEGKGSTFRVFLPIYPQTEA